METWDWIVPIYYIHQAQGQCHMGTAFSGCQIQNRCRRMWQSLISRCGKLDFVPYKHASHDICLSFSPTTTMLVGGTNFTTDTMKYNSYKLTCLM